MVDLDRFKEINDRCGHQAGDRVLKEFARTLREACRAEDIVCRYGGDEMAVILPDGTEESAEKYIRRLRSRLGDLDLALAPLPGLKLSVTIGYAVFPHEAETPEALVALADRRLFEQKRRR